MKRKNVILTIIAIAIVAVVVFLVVSTTLFFSVYHIQQLNASTYSLNRDAIGVEVSSDHAFSIPSGATNVHLHLDFNITGNNATNTCQMEIILTNETGIQEYTGIAFPTIGPIIYSNTNTSDDLNISLGPGNYILWVGPWQAYFKGVYNGPIQSGNLINISTTIYFTSPFLN